MQDRVFFYFFIMDVYPFLNWDRLKKDAIVIPLSLYTPPKVYPKGENPPRLRGIQTFGYRGKLVYLFLCIQKYKLYKNNISQELPLGSRDCYSQSFLIDR